MAFNPIPAWNVIVFEKTNEAHMIASKHLPEYLFTAYMNNPFPLSNARYYHKQTDTQSIYYLSPEASVISADLLNMYGAMLLLDEPDTAGFDEHFI